MQSIPILILDLDNTIIGDITYQALSYNLGERLKATENTLTYNRNTINKIISLNYKKNTGIIRPNFIKFFNFIKLKIPNILIFIYTASTKEWANKEILWIEKNNKIKFNRPLFTRENCKLQNNLYNKSVIDIFPIIRKKYKYVSIHNLLIIDNFHTYIDKMDNILVCPSYNYIYFLDLWDFIPKKSTNNEKMLEFIQYCIKNKTLNPYSKYILNQNHKENFKSEYYKWISEKYKSIFKNNEISIKDNFWSNFSNIINKNNITDFSKDNLQIIFNQLS